MNTMTKQAPKQETFAELMVRQKTQIQKALPSHMNAERMTRIILTEVRKTPLLQQCTTQSLLACSMLSAQLGLEPGPLGHVYFVPFKNESTFIIGYKGMLELCYRSDKIDYITAECVFANDLFEYEYGSNSHIKHVPADGDRGEFLGAYALVNFKGGAKHFRYANKREIDKARSISKSGNSQYSPWNKFYDEMACKTAIRRMFKYLPVNIVVQSAIAYDEASDYGKITYDETTATVSIEDKKEEQKPRGIEAIMGNEEEELPSIEDLLPEKE